MQLELPAETAASLAALGNLGVAQNTWSTYKTARTMIKKCETEMKVDLTIPFDQRKTLIFIDYLIRVRSLKTSTVTSYLAGVS